MDPVSALFVAALFADLVTGGWVHRKAWEGVTGRPSPVRSGGAPSSLRTFLPGLSRTAGGTSPRGGVGTLSRPLPPAPRNGRGTYPQTRPRPHPAPPGTSPVGSPVVPGKVTHRTWVWLWVRGGKSPGGARPASPGGRPGDAPPPGDPAPPRPPDAGGEGAGEPRWWVPGEGREPSTDSPGEGAGSPPSPGEPTTGDPSPEAAPPSPGDPSGEVTQPIPASQEEPVSVDVAAPNTNTEDVPAHIDAGLKLAQMVEDVAEQWVDQLDEAIRAHIGSGEGIQGFPMSLLGRWEDGVASPIKQARDLIKGAADQARATAEEERRALMPSVEAAGMAPADSNLSHQTLLEG